MNKLKLTTSLNTNRLLLTAAVIWIAVLAVSLAWNWHQVENTTRTLAENEARAYFEKDIAYRHWAAMHGGVYVQPTETTPPNPYLDHVPDRDVTTTGGKDLTLLNPSYMTRQVHALGLQHYDMLGHITSLNPLRRENAPDQWESQALLSFRQGEDRVSSVEDITGQQYLRFMEPLKTQESCLGCHGHQGYAVGDIQGGISVSVPWEPYMAQGAKQKTDLGIAHALIGVLGLLGLGMGYRLVRHSEMQLLESRDHTAATLHAISDGVFSCDKLGRIQEMNPAAENLTGWTIDECMGRPLKEVFNIVTLDDHSQEENPVSKALQQGRVVGQETYSVLIVRNGSKITIKKSCSPIKDNMGNIIGAVLVFRDITGEHTANLLTMKRLELYEYAEAHSLDELMTKVLDDAEEFVDSSIGFFHFVEKDQKTLSLQRWSTRSLKELCHMPGNKMHYPIDQAGVWVQAAREKRPVIHNDYESMPDKKGLPEGHARVIREAVVPVIRDNRVVAIMGLGNKPAAYDKKDVEVISFFADVTWDLVQQKRTQEALQNSQARLKTITDAAQTAIIMMDAQGYVSYWNPAAETILGYARDEAIGRDLHELIMPSRYTEDFHASFPEFQSTGQGNAVGRTTELYALTKNGREIPVELSLSSVLIQGQWHAIGIVRDITEKKQAQEELQRNARNLELKNAELDAARINAEEATKAKSEFLANMSHEIRTPMNGVIGMTGLLLDTDLDSEQQHYARTVRSSAESLLTVINDILDFSKIEAGRLDIETVDFDLEAMLRDFSGMMAVKAEEKGLELICSMDPNVPSMVRGDSGRLRQILMNLVGNAVKFTEHGEVEIKVSRMVNDECENPNAETQENSHDLYRSSFTTQHSCLMHFSVRDTGIGIPEDKQDSLFESFSQVDASTTRKFGGTGLGLAISRQLAEIMGGTAGLESVEGRGSTFWFTVRLGIQHEQQQERPAPACLQGVRTLIVDDNSTNRETLRVRLGSWGMRSEEAANGSTALSMLHQAKADNDPFEVAVLDMQMPDMDGETLGRNIKEDGQLKDTRLIMMSSATGQTGDAKRLHEAGFDSIMNKPVLPSELYACLEKILAKTDTADLVAEHAEREETPKGYPDFSGTKARILVAEDNMVNQQVALGILKKMGLRADAVANGREVLHALQNIPYDLVLMDVQMPEMDGLKATRRIRASEVRGQKSEIRSQKSEVSDQRLESESQNSSIPESPNSSTPKSPNSSIPESQNPRIPIIAMTAGAMQEDRERCIEAGMDDYTAKPVNPDELARVLEKWLLENRGQRAEDRSQGGKEEVLRTGEAAETKQEPRYAFTCKMPVFDQEDFITRIGHDSEMASEIMSIYLESIPKNIEALKKFIEQGQKEGATREAHSIKGNSGNVSCLAMAEIAGMIEEAGHAANLEQMGNLLPELERQFEICMAEIRKVMEEEH
ncbi:multi-sensor hybrid histidine kinase [Desulfonatronospira thiodismutans ASO3-1]|uniref:histidine kinase n=3 Tax=Desulfonatronospira TaxID=488937 RepID=D6SMJ6_9BACT|nr:PAS domain S-box protein [Desulfonatronospira thiodismutans]EFI35907.1 multi-sensor hybrid histidine kinase [Desulfonatronospira thiodismutans ASO3-1]